MARDDSTAVDPMLSNDNPEQATGHHVGYATNARRGTTTHGKQKGVKYIIKVL